MNRHLVIHFARFGPYHFTRLRSAMDVLGPHGWRVSGLQTAGTDATYAWDQTGLDCAALVTVFPNRVYEEIPAGDLREGMISMLDELKPDAVAIAGWGTPDARAALDWCRKNGAKAIVMSETRASDGERRWWKEWLKGRLIRRFDGALVGGKAHKDYLVQLGMPEERIRIGYDVVDNGHFARQSAVWRAKGPRDEGTERLGVAVKGEEWRVKGEETREQMPEVNRSAAQIGCKATKGKGSEVGRIANPYFLASSRFIERKNLGRLLEAYAEYRKRSLERGAWSGEQSSEGRRPEVGDQRAEGDQKTDDRGRRPETRWQMPEDNRSEAQIGCKATKDQCSGTEQRKPWDLVLLGTGDGREELERYVRDKGIEGVVFAGFQQIDALPGWYAGAGAFVHPALEEPWGLVINEAMASGLPIICSRTTGAAELVEEGVNGFLFDPLDTEVLSQLLLRVATMSSEERQGLGRDSARLIEEKLPVTAFGTGLAKLLGCVPS